MLAMGGDVDPRTVLPVAAAIAVFGVVFGAAAAPILGGPLAVATSMFVFSGSAQFSMVGLLAAGASAWAVLGTVAFLSLRHLALGAVLRPRLDGGRLRRAALAWFLIDETAGMALAGENDAASILARTGAICYVAWILGTVLGVLAGGAAAGLEALAGAIFPVLFVGLASMMATGAGMAARTLLAGALTLAILLVWPGAGGLAPILAAVAAAIPRDWR